MPKALWSQMGLSVAPGARGASATAAAPGGGTVRVGHNEEDSRHPRAHDSDSEAEAEAEAEAEEYDPGIASGSAGFMYDSDGQVYPRLDASQFLFVSKRVSARVPDCLEAKILKSFRMQLPVRQGYCYNSSPSSCGVTASPLRWLGSAFANWPAALFDAIMSTLAALLLGTGGLSRRFVYSAPLLSVSCLSPVSTFSFCSAALAEV